MFDFFSSTLFRKCNKDDDASSFSQILQYFRLVMIAMQKKKKICSTILIFFYRKQDMYKNRVQNEISLEIPALLACNEGSNTELEKFKII